MTIHLGAPVAKRLLRPTRAARLETGLAVLRPPRRPYSVLLPVGFAVPSLLPRTRCALTAPFHPYLEIRGGLLSVALSLGSPPPEVIRHRASKEPGLSSLPADTLATDRAAIRPADRGNKGLWALRVKLAPTSCRPSP